MESLKICEPLIDAMMDYVVVVANDGPMTIRYINSLFAEKGVVNSVRDTIGHGFYEVFPAFVEEREFQDALVQAKLRRKSQFIPRLEHSTRASKLKYYKVNISPLVLGGKIEGVILVFESLTQLVLESRMTSLLAEGMSHYINNVCNNLAAEITAYQKSHDEKYLAYAEVELSRISRVIENFFYLKHPSKRPAERIVFKEVLYKVLATELRNRPASDLVLNVSDDLTLSVDPVHLQNVLGILIQNALHASEDGKKIAISAFATESSVSVEVTNEGASVPDEILDKLNHGVPFTSSKAKQGKGVGMGFFIAKHVIEDVFEGTIYISNAENRVVSVIVTIPQKNAGGAVQC